MAAESMLVRYYTDCGPRRGPLLIDAEKGAIHVIDRPGQAGHVIGCARPSGWIASSDGKPALWSLEVGGRPVSGLWICESRRFVPL
jgi:hypothetical protein